MRVAIPPDLHPFVRKSLRALKPNPRSNKYERSKYDGLLRTSRGFLKIAVAADKAERAGRVLDQLVRLLEGELGGIIELGEWSRVTISEERFRFRLKQETTRSAHRPSPTEQRDITKNPYFNYVPKWDWRHTNKLTLEFFDDERYAYNPVARVRDGKHGRIEEKLAELPGVLRRLVQERKAKKAENERLRLAYADQRRREEEERARAEEEQRRRSELVAEAHAWREARLVLDYAAALEQAARKRGCGDDSAEMEGVRWARAVAASMDPLAQQPKP